MCSSFNTIARKLPTIVITCQKCRNLQSWQPIWSCFVCRSCIFKSLESTFTSSFVVFSACKCGQLVYKIVNEVRRPRRKKSRRTTKCGSANKPEAYNINKSAQKPTYSCFLWLCFQLLVFNLHDHPRLVSPLCNAIISTERLSLDSSKYKPSQSF